MELLWVPKSSLGAYKLKMAKIPSKFKLPSIVKLFCVIQNLPFLSVTFVVHHSYHVA